MSGINTTVDVAVERYDISYSTVTTDSLSTCLGILVGGSKDGKPFCVLCHTSQIDEEDADDDMIDQLVYLLENVVLYLTTTLNISTFIIQQVFN